MAVWREMWGKLLKLAPPTLPRIKGLSIIDLKISEIDDLNDVGLTTSHVSYGGYIKKILYRTSALNYFAILTHLLILYYMVIMLLLFHNYYEVRPQFKRVGPRPLL